MAYRIVQFDSLVITPHIQRGDQQDLGTGAALTSFLPLPGGGFYDNYQDHKSPQGIRPISKGGIFWGTADELRAEIQAWRAKIGKRGRLTVEWDDGSLRWQWARLQDLSTPRPSNAKAMWMPVTFTWITAAQNWRGVINADWVWGDASWAFGDGSTEMGVGSQTFALTSNGQAVTVVHNGDIDAPNVLLRLEMTGSWQDVTLVNETTGQEIIIDRPSSVATPMLEINAGARSIYAGSAAVAVGSMFRGQNLLQVAATVPGLVTGNTIRIAGSDRYDGDYYPVQTEGASEFYVPLPATHMGYGTVNDGTAQGLSDLYDLTTFSDRARWMVLAPGNNVIRVTWSSFPTTATLTAEFVDHYA